MFFVFCFLKGFNENIKQSKANASEALKLIPLIKKLIADANVTGAIASENADLSIVDTSASLSSSREAINSVTQANLVSFIVNNFFVFI